MAKIEEERAQSLRAAREIASSDTSSARRPLYDPKGALSAPAPQSPSPSPSSEVDFSGIETTRGRSFIPGYISHLYKRLDPSLSREAKASIIANVIEESGGDPFAVDATGKFRGILQWGSDRYVPGSETDPYRELDNQIDYLLRTLGNTTDRVSWTHGGKGSGYSSYRDALEDFRSGDLDRVMRGYTIGHVRPTGKEASYENRLKVARQIMELDGFR